MSMMLISAIHNYPMMYQFPVQLTNDPRSRYTVVRVNIPVRPVLQLPTVPLSAVDTMSAVPDEIQEDAFFQENTDPISCEPLFDPVADRNNPKHIYERASIVTWLQTHQTSPMTRQPMTVHDLVAVPELKDAINKKIEELMPPNPELQASHDAKLKQEHELALAKYEQDCRKLPLPERVHAVAQRAMDNPSSSDLASLRGRVTVISARNNPEAQKVQNVFNSIFGRF